MAKRRFATILTEGNYPEKGSIQTLFGVYPKRQSAVFIAGKVKERYRLPRIPDVVPTKASPTSYTVDDYIREKELNDEK